MATLQRAFPTLINHKFVTNGKMRRRGSDCVPPHHSKKLPDFSGSFFAGIKPYFLLLCLARLTLKIKSVFL